MKKLTALILALGMVAVLPQQGEALSFGVTPRIALPIGDFADVAGLGFGLGVNYRREVKGFPGMVAIGLTKFGEKEQDIFGVKTKSNTRIIFVNVGPRYYFTEAAGGELYGKLTISRNFVNTEAKAGGRTASSNSGANKLFVGIGLERGMMGAEAEYDLGGEWIGINLFYTVGGRE